MNSFRLRHAVHILRQGGVIAYPTEAVYGLGCDPLNQQALKKIYQLKQRTINKGFIIVASHFSQLEPYLGNLEKINTQSIFSNQFEHTTWILPANLKLPYYLIGNRKTIAVRISTHPAIISLCSLYKGAIISTSANLAGKSPAKTKYALLKQFKNKLDAIYFDTLGTQSSPSQIKDPLTGRIYR